MLQVLAGEKSKHIPCWFMRQAGRYLPEYRELRAKKGGFLEMAYDPEAACEITMQPIRRFGMDAAIIFSDILTIPHALGQHLEFVQGEGPKLEPIRSLTEIGKLSMANLDENLAPVYDALSLTRKTLSDEGFNETTLIGFAGAPWTVATYMIEGGGSKDFRYVKSMAYGEAETFEHLINIVVEATSHYLIKQIKAGAEVVKIFDSWASALDADQFQKWSVEPTKKIVSNIRDVYPNTPIIGFPRGVGINYKSYMDQTGITAIAIDSGLPTKWASENLQPTMPVQGNLDPMCLLAGGKAMENAARKIISDLSGDNFVFNLGHGINKHTPPEHVARLIEIIREA